MNAMSNNIDLKLVAQQIRKAREMLTGKTWCQRRFFDRRGCMCAHGALQVTSNPNVRELYDILLKKRDAWEAGEAVSPGAAAAAAAAGSWGADAVAAVAAEAAEAAVRASTRAAAAGPTGAAEAGAEAAEAGAGAGALVAAEDARPDNKPMLLAWGRRPVWLSQTNASSYVCGMVGLTAGYNDSVKLDAVLQKMDEAAKLADALAESEAK
jgi:hypothetical protein